MLSARVAGEPLDEEDDLARRPSAVHINDMFLSGDSACATATHSSHKSSKSSFVTILKDGNACVFNFTELKTRLLVSAGTTSDILTHLSAILSSYPDQWTAHTALIDALFRPPVPDLAPEGLSGPVLSHRAFLLQLQSSRPMFRGPFLAEIRLLTTALQGLAGVVADGCTAVLAGWTPSRPPTCWEECSAAVPDPASVDVSVTASAELARLLCCYCERFGDKPCCFADLRGYLSDLRGPSRQVVQSWLTIYITDFLATTCTGTSDESSVCRLTKYLQLKNLLLGSPEEASKHILGLRDTVQGLFGSIAARTQTSKEATNAPMAADDLLVMLTSAHAVSSGGLGANSESSDDDSATAFTSALTWAGVSCYGSRLRPSAFAHRISVLEPLRRLCTVEPAVHAFNALGVKYVQTDSMTYLIYPALMEGGMVSEAARTLRSVLLFHSTVARETGDMVVKAFDHCNYMKVLAQMHVLFECHSASIILYSTLLGSARV